MATWKMSTIAGKYALKYEILPLRPPWESPMEGLFYQEANGWVDGLECQYPVGKYRVDFAIPHLKVAIEIDGKEWHSTSKQKRRDALRQMWLEKQGWIVIRFTGSQVYQNASNCILQVQRLVFCLKYNQPLNWLPRYWQIGYRN